MEPKVKPMTTKLLALANLLQQKNLLLATAESCTGGGLGYHLTSIPGSSLWYERGFITYSNDAKIELLSVKANTLNIHGAVSAAVAREMAEGALQHSKADLTIAITGIAGPDGGSKDKPVGTVWVAFAGKNIDTKTSVNIYSGDREAVRSGVIQYVIEQLLLVVTAMP
jgi:nicotinamide-nucleotide amidase